MIIGGFCSFVVQLQQEPLLGPPGPGGGGYTSGPPGVVVAGISGGGVGFCCCVSTFVSVFAWAYVFTLAAAFAPLLALEDVAIRVLTFVLVNVWDSELESEAVAAPVLAPVAASVPAPVAASARFLPVCGALPCFSLLYWCRLKYKRNIWNCFWMNWFQIISILIMIKFAYVFVHF